MNGLSLCTGIGGLELGLSLAIGDAYHTACYVEHDPFCQAILQTRIRDGLLDDAPIWDDLTTFDGRPWRGYVDIVVAGFPCQPVSVAGQRKGQADERWLWPHVARIIRQVRPRLVFLENVPGLLRLGGWDVLESLAASGYDAEWDVFSARAVGAPHLRRRVFILANASEVSGKIPPSSRPSRSSRGIAASSGRELADAENDRQPRGRGTRPRGAGLEDDGLPLWPPGPADRDAWASVLAIRPDLAPAVEVEPKICHLANELSRKLGYTGTNRTHQLRALGNAVVPLTAAAAFIVLARRLGVKC